MSASKNVKRMVREHYGHNGVECRVGIKESGEVYRYGSPVETDRSQDFWVFLGNLSELSEAVKNGS